MKINLNLLSILLASIAAILLPCAAIASLPVIKPSSSFNSQSVFVGASATFTITATGDAPLAYQWRRDGAELPGQTNKALKISATQSADEGRYDVVVSNASGSVTSYAARLFAVPPTRELTRANHTNAARARLPYFYHLPTGYDPARRYPLILLFTGGGIDEANLFSAFPAQFWVHTSYARQAADPSLVVYVTRRAGDANGSWTPQYLEQTAALLGELMASFSVDTTRVYVVGTSQGAPAAWDLLKLRPGLFAAAALGAGWKGTAPALSIKDVPMRVWHAADDSAVNVSQSRDLVQALRRAGGHPIYTEFQVGDHIGGIGQGNMSSVIYDWLMAQRRGVAAIGGPRLSIITPASADLLVTSSATVDLAGSAERMGETVTRVSWENLTTRVKGDALGTDSWSVVAVPLRGNATNVIVVTATTASGFPVNGGTTTFSDTLFVLSLPITVTVAPQGSEAILTWTGGAGPYRIQRATDLGLADWHDLQTNAVSPALIELQGEAAFYRIVEP